MVTDNTSQADDTTAFLRAARSGNLEKVVEFLDTDLDINTANSNGLNALHLASKDGHVEIVTELLKRGARVDAATKKGNTALHIASLAGQSEIVNILIQYGAAVNIQSQNGFTPLYMAAQENHDQVVKLLLSNDANQSLATEDGFTPLAVAMQQGHDKVVSVLLENDSKGKVRLPALHIAAKKDDCKAADLLLQNDHKPDVTSKSGFTPLHIAAHYGNEEIARLLIKRGADVNYLAKHNISPLHVAAKWGKNNMVKILLENSAQIDAKTRDGLTPLHCAARSGHEQVVTTLLESSAPISARTKNGLAPLHMASQGDHVDAARVLLYHRAPVDEVTIDYLTSLHVAAHCGHVRVAKLLLDRKADPNARALNGFTPLHIACKKNRIKVVELLLKHGASIESTTESGLTPLHVASFMGCMNIVIFLLQHEANPDVPTVRGETPLHLAARANQTDIIRILLRNGAKVDARAREQQTPLHIASRLGNIDIVMLLLQHGAAVDTTTKDMYTALHIAAKEGQEEVAAILVDNNASLKAATKNGFTPLHVAAKYGNMNVAKILLQKEGKLDAQGKNDISPLQLACHYDHPNVANLLLEKGASPHLASQNGHTPLHIAARKNQMDIASTLLENGANANAESKAGFTPLHLSAQKGHYDMTNLLIEHGADPNHKAKNGLAALHLCAQEDFIRVASILVKNGANVESQTETGYRPIHVAAHFGNLSMIRFLLKHSAEIDVRTNQNYTPLHQAAQQGHAHIVTALLEGNSSHKARTSDGLTALNIAQKLGYISVMEVLKGLSYDSLAPDNKNWEEKYKVIAPESLQETSLMSDSDDEGGSDALISEQPYRYLTADLMKSLRDDSLPIDVTRDDPIHRQVSKEEKQEFTQSNNYCLAENFESNDALNLGRLHFRSFLVSFLVDARGGAMKGCRHSGVRIIVPPRRATMPTRVTCRLIKPHKVANPPPLMEGEALATRIIEMGPVGATFLGPVLVDIPHFASIRGKEREIIILRSENGETWKEHDNSADNDDTLINTPHDSQMSATHSGRITRIVTTDFPQYFAIVTRIKQEMHVIGAEGGILISSVASHVQAVFPPGALTKKIKVGLQAHVIPAELTAKLLGNCVAVSPVITIEPRRRKFHKPITLTIPVPQAANKGMINQYGGETPTLRLLCSIAGGTSEAQWEDVTGSTPLTFMEDRVSFTTTVSARFWLMDCRNISEVPKMATDLYKESLFVPYVTNFVIYSKRMDILEATLRILCMTDGKEGLHTLERQEEFLELVKSRDVEALDGKDLYIEFSGNLVPVTKSGVQLKFTFKAFRQNRLSFHVKVKDPLLDPVARMLFMREPKVAKGEPPQQPVCVLNIVLPESVCKSEITKKIAGYQDSNIINQKMDFVASKYTIEQKEKCDEPKETSPSEKKFIADTLQKEQTDAATIHDSFAQKAACPLESVDASYPNKVGAGQEYHDIVSEAERQTYSEKRKFWEDISRKRESYQRSESEVSRTSQLTINESDSEYLQNVVSEEEATEAISVRSETMEDMNVPDISECSVAEKAHYFEEQIQKELAKVPPKVLQQQESLKEDNKSIKAVRPTDQLMDYSEKKVAESIREKQMEESLEYESAPSAKEKEREEKEAEDDYSKEKEQDESRQAEKDVEELGGQTMMEICKEMLSKERDSAFFEAERVEREMAEERVGKILEETVEPVETRSMGVKEVEVSEEIARKKVSTREEKKVPVIKESKGEERMELFGEKKAKDVSLLANVPKEITKSTTVEDQEREAEELVRRKEAVPVREIESDTVARKVSLEKDVKIMETASEDKGEAKLAQDVPVERHEVLTTREEAEILEKPVGTRVVKEETTIIYKVQEDGSLVQEKVLKSVEIQGGQGQTVIQVPEVDLPMDSSLDIKKRLEDLLDSQKRMSEEAETVSEKVDLPSEKVVESEMKQIKKESRIPVFTAKADKDRAQKEVKSKTVTEVKQVIGKLETDKDSTGSEVTDVASPTKKKEFESRIPKRILDMSKQLETETKNDSHAKTESEVYTVTEKKSMEEVRSKQYQERSTTKKTETQTFTKTFADPQEAFQIFKDMGAAKEKEFSTITSKVDHKASSKVEKKEVISSEISTGAEKIITHEEKEHVERKKSSETKTTKESPIETTKEEKSESEELDRNAVQKMSMNLSAGKQVIDASASESRAESKKKGLLKSVEDREGITTQESGTSRIKESDVEVAVKIKKDDSEKIGEKGTAETDKVSDIPTVEDDLGKVEKLVQGETHKESVESFNVTQFVPREKDKEETLVKTKEENVEPKARSETLEERQQQTAKELHARKVAENLIDSIENMIQQIEFDETSTQSSAVPTYGLDKQYLDRLILGSTETDHEKLADDLTRKFEHIMKKSSLDDPSIDTSRSDYMTESTRLRSSIHEEGFERGSMRDSISISEDLTKDETSSPHDKEESFALSSLRGRLPDRDITISPSSISDQIELEETMDIDTNELEDTSKPVSSLQTDKSGARLDTSQKDVFGSSFSKDKVMSELSGARVVAICPPAGETGTGESQSRQDSMDVPSLELDEHKFSDEMAKDAGYLHKSAAVDSLEKIYQDRDITVSPSTVSEDTNVDYSLVHEQYPVQTQEHELPGRRADSFEIDSPPLVSPRSKAQGLEIKPVTWMIGDEKIEISETLQPSQVFNQELEEYESTMRQQDRQPSREGSTDFEQDTGTKSSEDTSVIETSVKEAVGEDATVAIKTTKFTVIRVNEQEFENELIENKLEISCQELVDALHRESLAKTPTEDLMNLAREGALDAKDATTDSSVAGDMSTSTSEIQTTKCTEPAETDRKKKEIVEEITSKDTSKVTVETVDKPKTIEPSSQKELSLEEKVEETTGAPYWEKRKTERVDDVSKEKTEACPIKVRPSVEELILEEKVREVAAAGPDRETHKSVDEVLKEWGDPYLTKVKPTMEEYKRQAEKTGAEKYEILMSGIDERPPSSVDLSARYAISVLGQVVKKEIAEVKESLEAAKQDLIEELSENSENVIQIKDSPSEFQFKLQPESIPNDLPFLYKPPSQEQIPAEREPETLRRESPITVKFDMEDTPEQKWGTIPRLYTPKKKTIPSELPDDLDETGEVQYGAASDTEKSERSERETATTVHDDLKEEEDWSHSPVPASRSSSDVDYKDDSFSLEPPQPAPRRRHRPARSSRKVASESEADLGSSSGDSSNYQSCDYESSSRPSSSDVEALQSAGIQSGTASEYETAMMSIEQSRGSKATSQEYHTAASTLSSRESMKSLNSLSSGHLGSIDSTSELSETLVPSETDMDREEIDENLEGILDEEHIEQSDSSGSDMPIDETVDKIDSNVPCRMKRSSEMIFQQVVEDNALETEGPEEVVERNGRGVDSSTSAFAVTFGALQSVDIMTSRVIEDGMQSVCTQVISTQVTTIIESKELPADSGSETAEGDASMEVTEGTMGVRDTATEPTKEEEEGKAAEAETASESPDSTMPRSVHSMLQQASMSTSSASGVSFDTVIEKEKSDRHSPDSDSFELVDKPDIIDDFVVIEEVGREAEEYDSEGKSIRISSMPPASGKNYDRDLENLITEKKEDPQISTSQKSRNNELFDFESEESPPQASNEDQYSQSYYLEEGFEGQKKWIEMQYRQDITRVCDVDYPRGPLEDIEEEEITEFRAGRSRFGSLGSHKESIGSASSVRGSFGSTPEFDVLSSMKYTPKRPNHDNVSLSSLQEFEQLESTVAAENSKSLQCGSQDSINNGSLPRRVGRSGHDDDISLSSLKDFEGLEKACREAHLIELKAREEEDLLEHESPENRYKLEALARAKAAAGVVGSTNLSDDYETRIKEIDEIIRIAQSNIEKIDHQDDTTEDISQIEITDMEKVGPQVAGQLASTEVEDVQPSKETNVMETSTDSLELEENGDKKHHPLCRSSDSLEMKTTLDFPSLSSDSLNNVRDAKDAQLDNPEQYSTARRISSDSLDIQLHEHQDVESHVESNSNYSERATSETSIRQTSSTDTNIAKNGETKASPPDSGT